MLQIYVEKCEKSSKKHAENSAGMRIKELEKALAKVKTEPKEWYVLEDRIKRIIAVAAE